HIRSRRHCRARAAVTTQRTLCGTPRRADAGTAMTVYGWVDHWRNQGGLIFLDLRDHSGILQVVIDKARAPQAHAIAESARNEWVMRASGELRMRDSDKVNPKLDTGMVEIGVDDLELLSEAKTPPFAVNEDDGVDEQLRLR